MHDEMEGGERSTAGQESESGTKCVRGGGGRARGTWREEWDAQAFTCDMWM